MMQAAVNCLVNDARRKLVWASILVRVRKSMTPYPRPNATRPLWTTSTAAPGASFDFSAAKMASIWLDETWAEPVTAEKTSAQSNVVASLVLMASPQCRAAWAILGSSLDHRHDSRRGGR